MNPTQIGITFIVISFLVIGAGMLSSNLASRRRRQLFGSEESMIPVNLASVNDAVLIAQSGGRITYANDITREWFNVDSGEPDLWMLSRRVTPSEPMLELFASEGKATFFIGDREVDATSHQVSSSEGMQFVVILRERAALPALDKDERGSPKALQVITEIGREINASLELDATLEAAFAGVSRLIDYDYAQITLWNQEQEYLRPIARVGPDAYIEAMAESNSVYHPKDGYTGWLARKRQPLLITNVYDFSTIASLRRNSDPSYSSYLGTPLNVRNRFIGALELMGTNPNAFDREDLAMFNLFADQIAIAIENSRKYEQQTARVAELSGLQKIAQSISALQDPYQLYAQLGERIATLTGTDMAGVLLYDAESEQLVAQRPVYGIPDPVAADYTIPLGKGSPAGSLWEDVTYWFSNNVPEDHLTRTLNMGMLVDMTGVKATAMVMMNVGGNRIGILQISNKIDESPFTLEDIRLLQIYADQAAIVVESVRLYGGEQSRVAELQGLQQIVQAMGSLTNQDELYDQLTRQIGDLMGVTICGFLLHDTDTDILQARAPFYGVEEDVASEHFIPVGKRGLAREVWRDYELFHSNNVNLDDSIDGLGMRDFTRNAGITRTLLAPMSAGGRRFGMMQVANKVNGTDFDDGDKRLLSIFAGQASALIENARLYQDTDATLRKRAAELRSVSRISHELNATLELERILEVIATEALRAEGAHWGNLVMFNWADEDSEFEVTMQFGSEVGEEARVLERAVLRSGETLVIDNFDRVDFYPSPLPEAHSALLVPIKFEEKTVGIISLYGDKARALGPSSAEFVQALSSQATIAVTNATRHDEQVERNTLIQERAEQMTQIFELGQMFRSDQSVEENLASVARAITEAAGFEVALISILEPEGEFLHPISHNGLGNDHFRKAAETPLPKTTLDTYFEPTYLFSGSYMIPHTDSTKLVEKIQIGKIPSKTGALRTGSWTRGDLLVVPLELSTGEFIGILVVDHPRDGNRPTRNTVELLEIFANQAAVVIENSRLFESAEERANELSASLENLSTSYGELDRLSQEMIKKDMELSQVNDLLNLRSQRLLSLHRIMETLDTVRDPEEVLKDIAAAVIEEMDIDQCLIAIGEGAHEDDKETSVRVIASEGKMPDIDEVAKLLNGKDPITSTYLTNSSVILAPGTSRKSVEAIFAKAIGSQTYVVLPMRLAAGKGGVLLVGTTRPGAAFDDEDRDLFTLLAGQIVVEYENANLYGAVQNEAAIAASERDRLQHLHLITMALQHTDALEQRLAVIARGIRSVGWGRVVLAMMDEDYDTNHLVTAGYLDEDYAKAEKLFPEGKVWQKRLDDPKFLSNRIGTSYFMPHDHPWVAKNYVRPSDAPDKNGNEPGLWVLGDQLYMPMYAGATMIGMINLQEPTGDIMPTEGGLRSIDLFIQQAASALENARLYQETLELQSFNEAILESIQQGIIVTDDKGVVESQNSYVAEQYGWPGDLVGKKLLDAQPFLKELPGFEEASEKAISEAKPTEYSGIEYRVGDEDRILNIYMYPRIDDETVTGSVFLIEDMTQRARLEADITQRAAQLAALSDATRHITATLSVEDVVESALEQAQEVIPYGQVTFWMYEEPNIRIAGARGYTDNEQMTSLSLDISDDPLFAEIASEQEVILIEDVREDKRITDGNLRPARSWLGTPLVSSGEMLGILVFEREEPQAYTSADSQVANALANQVSIALDNAYLFEESEQRASDLSERTDRLSLLNRISGTLSNALDQNTILLTTITELTQALDAEQGTVIILDTDTDTGRVAIQIPTSASSKGSELEIATGGSTLVKELNRANKPIIVNKPSTTPTTKVLKKLIEARNIDSVMLVPVVVGTSLHSILLIEHTDTEKSFKSEQVELAQTVTNQIGISIQNAQLFQETVNRRTELGILFEAGRIASSSLDLDTVVKSAAGYFTRAIEIDGVMISLWDEKGDTLTGLIDYVNRKGPRDLTEEDNRYKLEDYPVTYSVITERGAVSIDLSNPHIADNEKAWLESHGYASVLMLPLSAPNSTIGLVELWRREPGRFGQREIGMGRALSTTMATAMENARLHDETEKRLGELGQINEISRGLTGAISTEDLYVMLQVQIVKLLDVESLTLALPDPITGELTFPLALRDMMRVEIEPISYGADLYSYVIDSGEPLFINHHVDERVAELGVDPIEKGLKSIVVVPLHSGDEVLGVLAIEDYKKENAFSESDQRVLEPVAAQIAVSMINTRLYGELEQRLSETTTLQEVSRMVNSALDLREIFEQVVEQLAASFDYPLIALYTLEEGSLMVQASHGYSAEEAMNILNLSLDTGIVGRAARTKQTQFVKDVSRDPDYILINEWIESMIAIPISSSEESIMGVLTVQTGDLRPISENDVQMLETFAGQVSTAMANAKLFEQMVRLSEELEVRVEERTLELTEERDRIDTLYSIAVELTISLDLDLVLNRALELVGEAVGADSGSLFLIDPTSDKLIWRAQMHANEMLPPGGRQIALTRHEGLAGWVMDKQESIIIDNVQDDDRWTNVPGTEERRSILGAPLLSSSDVLGCIFFNSNTEEAFKQGHLQLVEAAAIQVANSINNAELFRLIRDQAERLGTMLRSQQTEAAKSQAILESVADGVMVSDGAGQIILFNAASERILDLRREEVLGRTITDLTGLYGSGAEHWVEMLEEWSADPESHEGDFLSEQIEVGEKVVSVHVSPAKHGVEYLGLVSVFRDISKEVAADRIKSEFVATVSHELRTPLTAIKGYADLLLIGAAGDLNPDQKRFLDIVKNNADRLSLLVADLLDISKIEQGGVELDLKPVDIYDLIENVIKSVELDYGDDKNYITLVKDIPDDLPKLPADYDRITQIFNNLVSNAYQYSDEEGTVTVRIRVEDEGVRFWVIDEGLGIPDENKDRIFDRFFRGEDPMVMSTAGTGLGLSIVQHLIEMHKGTVNFESEEGKGTTFTLWIPL